MIDTRKKTFFILSVLVTALLISVARPTSKAKISKRQIPFPAESVEKIDSLTATNEQQLVIPIPKGYQPRYYFGETNIETIIEAARLFNSADWKLDEDNSDPSRKIYRNYKTEKKLKVKDSKKVKKEKDSKSQASIIISDKGEFFHQVGTGKKKKLITMLGPQYFTDVSLFKKLSGSLLNVAKINKGGDSLNVDSKTLSDLSFDQPFYVVFFKFSNKSNKKAPLPYSTITEIRVEKPVVSEISLGQDTGSSSSYSSFSSSNESETPPAECNSMVCEYDEKPVECNSMVCEYDEKPVECNSIVCEDITVTPPPDKVGDSEKDPETPPVECNSTVCELEAPVECNSTVCELEAPVECNSTVCELEAPVECNSTVCELEAPVECNSTVCELEAPVECNSTVCELEAPVECNSTVCELEAPVECNSTVCELEAQAGCNLSVCEREAQAGCNLSVCEYDVTGSSSSYDTSSSSFGPGTPPVVCNSVVCENNSSTSSDIGYGSSSSVY